MSGRAQLIEAQLRVFLANSVNYLVQKAID